MIKIISLTGSKQSGKTTAYNTIKENFPNIQEIMLAKRIKDVCALVFGFARSSMEDAKLKEKELDPPVFLDEAVIREVLDEYKPDLNRFGIIYNYDQHIRPHIGAILYSRREIMQYVGTELLKNIDNNIHCKVATRNLDPNALNVVTDLRFPDEFAFFNNYECSYYPYYIFNRRAEVVALKDKHSSEVLVFETAKTCIQIDNNKTLTDLQLAVVKNVREILEKE